MRRLTFFTLLFLTGFGLLFVGQAEDPAGSSPKSPAEGKVIQLTIDNVIIGPVIEEYIKNGIEQAETSGAQALLIRLDTPGGLLDSTREIVKDMLGAKVPVIVYVAPDGARAGSAGVFITLAADIAAMAPSTNIGAAHPVTVGGGRPGEEKSDSEGLREILRQLTKDKKDKEDEGKDKVPDKKERVEREREPMEDKILNDTIAWVRSIAQKRGRNVEWAEKAVRESSSITAQQALKKGVIDLIAPNVAELLQAVDGRKIVLADGTRVLQTAGASVVDQPMSLRQNLLSILINPNIAYILMMIGFYGLLFEVTHPGSWFPGIAGLIGLILAFYAFNTIPTNYAGLALIFLALALFVAEAFVPSFGLLTAGGVVAMILGSLFLIDSPFELMQISYAVIFPIVAATAFIAVFLVNLAVRSQRSHVSTGFESMVGSRAVVDTAIKPEGKVFINGELWNARSEELIDAGEEVEVVSGHGMLLQVKKVKKES